VAQSMRGMWLLLIAGTLLAVGCKRDRPTRPPVRTPPAVSLISPDAAPTARTDAAPGDAAAAARRDTGVSEEERVGIPECDAYLAGYTACVARKVPMAQRPAMMQTVKEMRAAWKKAAKSKAAIETMANTCKMMRQTARKTMAKFGCKW
jgi:hypothetical protein